MTTGFRCAAASLARSESLIATASTVRAFLLVEFSGAWGREALQDARLPAAVRRRLVAVAGLGVKVLLVRRHGRARRTSDGHVFAAWCERETAWLEGTRLESLRELSDLDLDGVSRGRSVGLPPVTQPLIGVCTHGRHDTGCAELGRPLAAALSARHPELVWEISHVGGDRFAGNLLILPEGLYYGRVAPDQASALVAGHLEGRLDLDHLRGRSASPLAVQAAEHFVRRRLHETRIDALAMSAVRRTADVWEVDFQVGPQTWRGVVGLGRADPAQLTCAAVRPGRPPSYREIEVTRIS